MHPIVEIKKPCHEALEKRKVGEPGNYCKTCQTLVIDFTRMSPEEISNYFANHGVTCGTFNQKDVSTGSVSERLISYLEKRKLKFLASFILAVMLLAGCRSRSYAGAPGMYSDSIRNLGDTTTTQPITKPD